MAKKQSRGKAAAAKADWVTVPYSTVVFYVLIGLIIGMALGALALLWAVREDRNGDLVEAQLQGQILRTTQGR
jgi:uncharacterized membrane-anchored protein YhcB (DUF1043 family)